MEYIHLNMVWVICEMSASFFTKSVIFVTVNE